MIIAEINVSELTTITEGIRPAISATIPAQVIEGFNDPTKWIRHDLWVETEFDTDGDGLPDRMHVSVTRPQATENGLKLPVIYNSSPYFAGTAKFEEGLFWDVKHELGEEGKARKHVKVERKGIRPVISTSKTTRWVPRGFIVVHSSAPGTGLSQGSPTVGGDNESLAPKAVIEWLGGKDNGYTSPYGGEKVQAYWSTGRVGMTGPSYEGTLPLAAATTGVDALKAVIPVAPNTSYYHYYRSNGLVRSPGGYLGEDIDVLYDFIHSGDESKRAYADRVYRDSIFAINMDRITGDYNDFWKERDMLYDMDNMKAALFMSHGFNDWNVMPEHSYRIYNKAREMGLPVKIYYHQDGHGGPPPFDMMNEWFTKYLFEVDNNADEGPRAWIVRESDPRENPTAYEDYPNPASDPVTLYLSGDGNSMGSLSMKKTRGRDKDVIIDDVSYSGAELAQQQASEHRLMFTLPVLERDLHISGIPEITIRLASSKPATNLSVWLISL
ncbi:MAG: CocE/NonD family hydrolase, partial [Cyclobacteriaceae bacterium]